MQVYKITNKVNGKVYIGATSLSLHQRMLKHLTRAKQYPNRKFYKDLLQYGRDNFTIECIMTTDDYTELYAMEAKFIEAYDTIQNGYNTLISAPHVDDWDEFFEIHKTAMQTTEVRQKISNSMKAYIAKNGFSESHRKRISEALKGKKFSDERKKLCDTRSIGCYCITENGERFDFHSYRDAWKWWMTVDNPFDTITECIYQRKIKQSISLGYYTYGRNKDNKYFYPKWYAKEVIK